MPNGIPSLNFNAGDLTRGMIVGQNIASARERNRASALTRKLMESREKRESQKFTEQQAVERAKRMISVLEADSPAKSQILASTFFPGTQIKWQGENREIVSQDGRRIYAPQSVLMEMQKLTMAGDPQSAMQYAIDNGAIISSPEFSNVQAKTVEALGIQMFRGLPAEEQTPGNFAKIMNELQPMENEKPTSLMRHLGEAGLERGTPEYESTVRDVLLKPTTSISLGKAPQGYRWKEDKTLEAIPGGPAEKLSAEHAAKAQLLEGGAQNVEEFKQMLFDSKGNVDRQLIGTMATRLPFTAGRTAYTLIYDAIEAKLRAESGAAVPETEVRRMAKRFVPSPLDSDETIKVKIDKLEVFLKGASIKSKKGRDTGEKQTQMLFDSKGNVDRQLIATMDGGTAHTLIYDAIEAKLRAEPGAAVPETEIRRMAKRFVPSPRDNDETIKVKIDKLEVLLKGPPQEAIDHLIANPRLKSYFKEKYGYLPEGF